MSATFTLAIPPDARCDQCFLTGRDTCWHAGPTLPPTAEEHAADLAHRRRAAFSMFFRPAPPEPDGPPDPD